MTFLNLILLGGAAAFAIPLIIHLLNRRRLQVVHWGAMHLLEDVMRKNHQRLKLEQLLLLLIRIALPIILALLMARPVLTGMRQFTGDQQTSTVILIDDSYGMQAGDVTGSRFSRAREEISQIIEKMPRGSDASVVLMGSGGRTLLDEPTAILESLPAHLRDREPLGNSVDVTDSLRRAAGEFERMQHAAREVIIVSGFQASAWGDEHGSGRLAALETLTDSATPPVVTLLPVGGGSTDNLSVGPVSVSAIILGVGQRFSVRAEVTNHGTAGQTDVPVHFDVNGQRIRTSRISLAPGQVTQVLFNHTFDEPGDHHVLISTEGDALAEDNYYHLVLPVWDEVPAVLVNGAPGQRPLEGETDFLEIALQPFRSTDASLNDLITSQVVLPNGLNRELINDARVVILANVERLEGRQREELESFVEQGGGLIVFPGDNIDSAWYNHELHRDGAGLLPLRIGPVGQPRTRAGTAASGARIAVGRFTHPTLEYFNDPRNGRLSDALFTRWYQLHQPIDEAAAALVNMFARLDNGDPLFVERPFGNGRVLQAAVPADNDWGNLPTQPVYVPLMQRLVTHVAASSAPPVNLLAGEPLRAIYPEAVAGQRLVVVDATGQEHVTEVRELDGRGVLEFTATERPGLYRVLPPAWEGPAEDAPGEQRFAFNLSLLESDLTPLSEEQLTALASEMNAELVRSAADHSVLDRARRFGQEIWKPLLWVVLVLLFAELLLQQWMARRRVA